MFGKTWCLALSAAALVGTFAVGCGSTDETQEPVGQERQALEDGIPWWLVEIPSTWGCDQTLQGAFRGFDSAHMVRFPGKVGYRYTFSFDATYPAYKGAAIGVYDAETGEMVAFNYARQSNKIAVDYEAAKSVEYLVAVYSISWSATGSYALHAGCTRTGYCLEYETTDDAGVPLNNFYAINVPTYDAGKQILAGRTNFFNEAIKEGTCADQGTICPMVYAPVCADTPPPQTKHGNVCAFKAHVRQQAGTTGEWKGHWEKGECDATGKFCGGIAGLPCPDGFVCQLDGSYPDAGGHCERAGCEWEGQSYAAGDSFPAGDGCNTCSCTDDGKVRCTEMMCQCNPDAEWWRSYKSTDPNMCAVMKFYCQPHTTPFFNNCGCGCEQDASCPQTLNCMPPAPAACSPDALTDCPFTQVVY